MRLVALCYLKFAIVLLGSASSTTSAGHDGLRNAAAFEACCVSGANTADATTACVKPTDSPAGPHRATQVECRSQWSHDCGRKSSFGGSSAVDGVFGRSGSRRTDFRCKPLEAGT